jgi:SAM-dependent methyltransferase
MKIQDAHLRLNTCWGEIDRTHNSVIAERVFGKRVLDIGCGFGSLVHFLSTVGLEATGIDSDPDVIGIVKAYYPQLDIRGAYAECLDFPDNSFDTVVFKDTFHHILGEGDTMAVFSEVKRVLAKPGTIIIFDPNPNWPVRVGRRLVNHSDPEASLPEVMDILGSEGFSVESPRYYETFGLALSGGYVGPRWTPNLSFLNRFVALTNDRLSNLINRVGLGPHLCWRYLVVARIH